MYLSFSYRKGQNVPLYSALYRPLGYYFCNGEEWDMIFLSPQDTDEKEWILKQLTRIELSFLFENRQKKYIDEVEKLKKRVEKYVNESNPMIIRWKRG